MVIAALSAQLSTSIDSTTCERLSTQARSTICSALVTGSDTLRTTVLVSPGSRSSATRKSCRRSGFPAPVMVIDTNGFATTGSVPSLRISRVMSKGAAGPAVDGVDSTDTLRFGSGGRVIVIGPNTALLLVSLFSESEPFASVRTTTQYCPSSSSLVSGSAAVRLRERTPPGAMVLPPEGRMPTGTSSDDGVGVRESRTRSVHAVFTGSVPAFDSSHCTVIGEPKTGASVATATALGTRSGAGVATSSNGPKTAVSGPSPLWFTAPFRSARTMRNRGPPS